MYKYVIDGKKFSNIKKLHEYFASIFDFPSYYGKNFNAMWDCLSECLGDWGKDPAEIVWINMRDSKQQLNSADLEVTIQLLNDLSEHKSYNVTFKIFEDEQVY